MGLELLGLICLILLNGFFAMSEVALITARKARLVKLSEGGDHAAAIALALHNDPTRLLSTVQIGITSIGILSGIVGEAVLSSPLSELLQRVGVGVELSRTISTALVVIVVTYFSIVIGELVPKRLGLLNAEGIARLVARPMRLLALFARPFVRLLSGSTNTILRLLGRSEREGPGVTEEEIHAILREGSEAGVIEPEEHAMVHNIFKLDDRQLGTLMVPRGAIEILQVDFSEEQILNKIASSQHSRFPVCRGDLSDVIGIVTAKSVLTQTLKGKIDLTKSLQPPLYVSETLTGMELLERFRTSKNHMALVVDEYGVVIGLVTLQDILEAVAGEFNAESGEESWAVKRKDGSWLLDGLLPIPELKDKLSLRCVPNEEKRRYHTLAGLVMNLLGSLPKVGDVIVWENWSFEIMDMDGKRIDKVLASQLTAEEKTKE